MLLPPISRMVFSTTGFGKLLQRLPGPHRVDLHLRGALDVIEHVIGVGDGGADRRDAVIGHEQHLLVADHPGEAGAFGGIERRAGVFVVIGDLAYSPTSVWPISLMRGSSRRVSALA